MASFNPFQFVKAPALDADQASSQLALQQRQQLVDMLKQQVMNPAPVQNYGAIASRTSPITPIVQALMARKAAVEQQGLNEQYSNLFNKQYEGMAQMFGGQPQSVPVGNDAQGQPQTTQQTPTMMQGVPDAKYAEASVGPSQSPMNPGGLPSQMATRLYMQDPAKYVEQFVAPYYKPSELEAQLRAAGISPNSTLGRQIAQQSLAKATNIAPVAARPGTALVNPVTNQPVFYNPNSAPGSMPTFGPNGMPQSIQQIPGATSAIAAATGAETGAKVANTPMTVPTGGGGSAVGYPGSLIGNPPVFGGGSQAPKTSGNPQPGIADPMFKDVPKLNVPTSIGAPSAFTESVLKGAAEKHNELATKYGMESDAADQTLAFNKEALQVLDKAETGPLSDKITALRAKAQELGISDSFIPGADKIANTQELKKYLVRQALITLKPTFGARPAASEFAVLKDEANPSDKMTSLAIKRLMDVNNQQAEYQKQRAEDYGKYVQAGGDPQRFEGWYSRKKPLSASLEKLNQPPVIQAPPQALEHLKAHPELKEQFKAKYGYLPNG